MYGFTVMDQQLGVEQLSDQAIIDGQRWKPCVEVEIEEPDEGRKRVNGLAQAERRGGEVRWTRESGRVDGQTLAQARIRKASTLQRASKVSKGACVREFGAPGQDGWRIRLNG